jgi:hypothetical protein
MSVLGFYPNTCHPSFVTRRQFLAGAGAVVALAASNTPFAEAGDDGTAVIKRYANAPDNPWAVCHGIRGMGREFPMKSGESAVNWLLQTHIASLPAGGTTALAFPLEVEVHPNMFLKTLLEAGVPLDYAFKHRGDRRTLREVVDGARALFRPSQVLADPNMLPWTLIAFSRTVPPLRGKWRNGWDEPVDLDIVVETALKQLEDASLPIRQAMREDRPEREKAPVHGFTCGGTHMIYGLLSALHGGYVGSDRLQRMRQQIEILVWRLKGDLDLIDAFYLPRRGQKGMGWFELGAKLKLLGHSEECLAFTERRGVVHLSAGQQAQRRVAVATLRHLLDDLEAHNLAEAREINKDLFQQLVGDTCHARHGLTFA